MSLSSARLSGKQRSSSRSHFSPNFILLEAKITPALAKRGKGQAVRVCSQLQSNQGAGTHRRQGLGLWGGLKGVGMPLAPAWVLRRWDPGLWGAHAGNPGLLRTPHPRPAALTQLRAGDVCVHHNSQHPMAPARIDVTPRGGRRAGFLQRSFLLAALLSHRYPLLSAQHVFSFHCYNLSSHGHSGFILLGKKRLPPRAGAALVESRRRGFEPGNPFSLHLSPTRAAGSPPESDPMVRNRSKQKDERVLSHFCLIRQKWIPLRTPPQSPGTSSSSQSRVLVTRPEKLMRFFKSFQRPGCDRSDSADIAHAPPDNSPLGKAVSTQGLGPSCQQIVIAGTKGLPGRQTSSPLNQNNPSEPKVCYLLLRTSQTHLLRNGISPFRSRFPGFSKGSFKSRWGVFLFQTAFWDRFHFQR